MPDLDGVDMPTFSQILEMDENEEERDFSKPLVEGFLEQAKETFGKMDQALKTRNLGELSSLGHFLKGSSATLGFNKIRDSCQVIQQYGHKSNVDGTPETNEEVCFARITAAIEMVKLDLKQLQGTLREFFNDENL